MKKVWYPPVTERMKPKAVGRIMDQLFPQFLTLVVTPQEAEEEQPLLMAAETDAAVDRVYQGQIDAKARCDT